MPRATIRAGIANVLAFIVPSNLSKVYTLPQDNQKQEFAPSEFPVAEIHYLQMDSVNLTNHEYENTYLFGIVVYIDMANLLIGDCESQMDGIHDAIINLFANNQTLDGVVDVGLIPTPADPIVIEWKGRNLYATMFVIKCRESITTD